MKEMIENHRDLVVEEYSWFRIFLLIFIITAVIGFFGLNYFSSNLSFLPIKNKKEKVTPTMTVKPSPTPKTEKKTTLTPTKALIKLKRQDLKIQVLNGSQTAGLAKKTKEFLEKLGYQEIDIGNADNNEYKATKISLTSVKKDYFSLLVDDLKDDYQISSQPGELKKDSDYDVVIIIGED
jgi:hypothetical protein